MREILFRGKRVDNNEWVEGSLIKVGEYCCILQEERKVHPMDFPYLDNDTGCIDGYATPVIPETVGQYVGIKDKNGKKVYEGDIVKTKYGRLCRVVRVSLPSYVGWDLEAFDENNALTTKKPDEYDLYYKDNLEVIGNIFDKESDNGD